MCGWIKRTPGGTRENDGLEIGITGAAARGAVSHRRLMSSALTSESLPVCATRMARGRGQNPLQGEALLDTLN